MARKNNTPAPPVPDSFRENYRSEYAPIPCRPSFKRGIDRLPDDVAGRLLKAILEHSTSGGAATPAGMDEFAFDMLISKVDEFLMDGMERKWRNERRAKAGAAGRWGETPGEAADDNAQACLSMHKDAQACLSISKEEKNEEKEKEREEKREKERSKEKENKEEKDKSKRSEEKIENLPPTAPLRGGQAVGSVGSVVLSGKNGNGWDEWFEDWTRRLSNVNLSDYLTEQEEYELNKTNGERGGYVAGAVESFVTSEDFDKEDPPETKKRKLAEYKKKYDGFLDGKHAELKNDTGKNNVTATAHPSTAGEKASSRKPSSYSELEDYLGSIGHPEFDSEALWHEMEQTGWRIPDRESGEPRPLRSWRNFVRYRAESNIHENTTPQTRPSAHPVFATPEDKKLHEEYLRGNYNCSFEGFKAAKTDGAAEKKRPGC